MISYPVYKLIHFLGIFMVMCSLGGLVLQRIQAGSASATWRRPMMATHGLGLFLALLGGFGMLARMGLVNGLPGWIHAKLTIWFLLGVVVVLLRFKPQFAKPVWWASFSLAALAAYFAINKPF